MRHQVVGLSVFWLGVFLMLVHTTLPFLWNLLGLPWAYPLIASQGPLAILPGFTLPVGALLLVLGGLIYGQKARS